MAKPQHPRGRRGGHFLGSALGSVGAGGISFNLLSKPMFLEFIRRLGNTGEHDDNNNTGLASRILNDLKRKPDWTFLSLAT
ncbi:hypothetical protein [Leisingera sp. JC1]|uniref:hypothetical protein n=1 Tax=Leisingera sp. JC1 TaxID=1855282 RepID=UPI001131C402|nr:hypothetical protein [Leisingera sp. JC1]